MMRQNLLNPRWAAWSLMFGLTALWTLLGAVPGFFFPDWAYQSFHGTPPPSPEVLDLFKGSWGQTLLFGLGYGFAALDPVRHGLVGALGAAGKVMFSLRILTETPVAELSGFPLLALSGDLVFATLILLYLVVTGQGKTWFRRQE